MNVLTCCKVVPDLEMLTDEDWAVRDMEVELRFAKREWNVFDESVLEMALRLRDAFGASSAAPLPGAAPIEPVPTVSHPGAVPAVSPPEPISSPGVDEIHLTALNIGDKAADPFLKNLLALRYDRVVRIDPGEDLRVNLREDLRFSPAAIAGMIAGFVGQQRYDLILFGRQSGVGDSGQVPLFTAELLGLPCVTQVRAIKPVQPLYSGTAGAEVSSVETGGVNPETVAAGVELPAASAAAGAEFPAAAGKPVGSRELGGRFIVESYTDDGILEQEIIPPCVLAVGNAEQTYLRVPTLKDKMKYGSRPIEVLSSGEVLNPGKLETTLVGGGGGFRLLGLERIDTRREGLLLEEGSAAEKARKVYDLYLKKRLGKLWTTR